MRRLYRGWGWVRILRPGSHDPGGEAALSSPLAAVAFAVASETRAPRDIALEHALSYAREPYDDPVGPFKERGPATGVILRHGYIEKASGSLSRQADQAEVNDDGDAL
jgi:hypothetical protein